MNTSLKTVEAESRRGSQSVPTTRADEKPESSRQFVLLTVGDETYGIEIGLIHGIIMPQAVTEVPKTPAYVKGVTNLRGNILPVIDMRTRFGLKPTDADTARQARFVVVETQGLTAALVVDAVSEVAHLRDEDIEPPTRLLHSDGYEYMRGVGKLPEVVEAASGTAAATPTRGREKMPASEPGAGKAGRPRSKGKNSGRLVMILDVPKLLDRGLRGKTVGG